MSLNLSLPLISPSLIPVHRPAPPCVSESHSDHVCLSRTLSLYCTVLLCVCVSASLSPVSVVRPHIFLSRCSPSVTSPSSLLSLFLSLCLTLPSLSLSLCFARQSTSVRVRLGLLLCVRVSRSRFVSVSFAPSVRALASLRRASVWLSSVDPFLIAAVCRSVRLSCPVATRAPSSASNSPNYRSVVTLLLAFSVCVSLFPVAIHTPASVQPAVLSPISPTYRSLVLSCLCVYMSLNCLVLSVT